MSKPTYADLIARRSPTQRRTVRRPFCIDVVAWDAYIAAKTALAEAEAEAEKAAQTYADRSPVTEAAEAFNTAAQKVWDMSLWIVFNVPSALEQDRIHAKLEKTEMERGTTEWLIAYLADRFAYATTIDGDPVGDFTADALRSELEGDESEGRAGRTNGELAAMQQAIGAAIIASDFPTPPKR